MIGKMSLFDKSGIYAIIQRPEDERVRRKTE